MSPIDVMAVSASLSVRRAWIEIRMALFLVPPTMVALRKESVDRNSASLILLLSGARRSP